MKCREDSTTRRVHAHFDTKLRHRCRGYRDHNGKWRPSRSVKLKRSILNLTMSTYDLKCDINIRPTLQFDRITQPIEKYLSDHDFDVNWCTFYLFGLYMKSFCPFFFKSFWNKYIILLYACANVNQSMIICYTSDTKLNYVCYKVY